MIYKFERFTLDAERRELRCGRELVRIEPQVFDVLQHLIENHDRVVSNDDLIEAVWRGRIVSEATVSTRMNAVRRAIGDSGERQQFIRTIARKGYRFVGEVERIESGNSAAVDRASATAVERTDTTPANALTVPDTPSIAVLPFTNISGDPEQEYFADGITEDLITALSQFRWLFVIARNSSFVFKGKTLDAKEIARELGVRYLLIGSVRKADNRVRITGQLIEASTGAHLWADRFDDALEDIFDLQDKVTASVLRAIGPKLEQAEIDRAKRKPTESLDAYDYYLRAMASVHQWTRPANDEALRLFSRAVEIDAEYSSAYGMAAWCYAWRKMSGWVSDREREVAETTRLARRALELGKDDVVALCSGGWALAYVVGELDDGAAFIDRALELNPNFAWAWLYGGWLKVWLGEPEVAIKRIEHAMRLSPNDPIIFLTDTGIAVAHFFAGRFDVASSWAQRALRVRPDFAVALRVAAASNALAGRLEAAQKAMEHLRQIDPTLRISDLKNLLPHRPADLAMYEEGLRKAGLPE